MKKAIFYVTMVLMLAGAVQAQENPLKITGATVAPAAVARGGKAIISCYVSHSQGPAMIDKVAATGFFGPVLNVYPQLYDNGTNGDKVEGDGIYSLAIEAPQSTGQQKIVIHAVDKNRQELDSDPVFIEVK